MKKILAAALLMLGMGSVANAAVFNLTATIDGLQSGTGSSATGFATMSYDDVTGLFDWNIQWTPLEGIITVAHFHGPAAPGINAGVQVDWLSISGNTSPSIGSTTIDAAQGADLLAGLWYINIHSSLFPGGEIRGQVQPIPLPAAVWFMLSGLGVLGALRRRG